MVSFKRIYLLCHVLLVIILADGGEYGEPCRYKGDCDEDELFCTEGRCRCSREELLQYGLNGNAMCGTPSKNSPCEEFGCLGSGEQECLDNICICKNKTLALFFRFCMNIKFVKPMEKCDTSMRRDLITACDPFADNTFCHYGRCHCFRKFFYNYAAGECQLKLYPDQKASIGGYCLDFEDCEGSLTCKEDACICPKPCIYNEDDKLCDCSRDESSFLSSTFIYIGIACTVIVGCLALVCRIIAGRRALARRNERRQGLPLQFRGENPLIANSPGQDGGQPYPVQAYPASG